MPSLKKGTVRKHQLPKGASGRLAAHDKKKGILSFGG